MENESKIKSIQTCRTCMEEIMDTSVFVYLDSAQTNNTEPTIKQKLSNCIPEVDLHITANTVICNKCVDVINIMHEFKNGCLRSEIQIHKYIQQVQHVVVEDDQLCMEFKTDPYEITEDFEIKDFHYENLTTSVYDANAVKEEDEGTEIVKQEYASNLSISTVEDSLDKYDKISNIVQNYLQQVVDDRNDNIPKLCKNDVQYYECFMCGYKAKSKSELILHVKTHTSKKPFKCSVCEYSCTQRSHLIIHVRVHTGEKPFKCSNCEYSCTQKSHLNIHMRIHTGEKPFKCTICEYRCTQKTTLNVHMRMHAVEKPFKCLICAHSFALNGDLKIHMRMHARAKPFKCSICEYSCTRKNNLNIHMRMHTGEKPFKCSICEYGSITSSKLKRHMRIHTGEKPFKCFLCKYSSTRSDDLKTHIRSHTGEKPFKCLICDYSCVKKNYLKRHIMQIHNGERNFPMLSL